MAMRFGAASFRHIVDVDGQLHGIENRCVDARAILALAGLDGRHPLYRVHGDLAIEIEQGRPISLSEDEVAFFRSGPAMRAEHALPLAA